MTNYISALLASFIVLCVGTANAEFMPLKLPPPLTLNYPNQISTDGVGRIKDVVLKLSREYTANNQVATRYELEYFFGNGNAGETWRGEMHFTIDLLDRHGVVVVRNLVGNVELPRYRCWYGGGANQYPAPGYIKFDYTRKHIRSMRINVSHLVGVQTPC